MRRFYAYEEIPTAVEEYILTVSGAESIRQIPLGDINAFIVGYAQYQLRQSQEDAIALDLI
jgi:hypothetical protein